jgi:putative ABC transport system permease protein
MLTHNLKQIVRSLLQYKGFTFINLLGLFLGITAVVLIFLINNYENSFDHFRSGSNHIYRVVSQSTIEQKEEYNAQVPYTTAALQQNYAGATSTQIHFSNDMNVRIGKKASVKEKEIIFADSLFFKVFDFSSIKDFWVSGNPAIALNEPRKAVLTTLTAQRYFDDSNPIGQLIRLDNK